ncbi:MAG TPA: adenylate/guanylate cyclase domain-containing protein [Gaiellaceae bacterium]|nr:adenylate/guanylate cyclase domain-containing protein [Gaiellaceae bacterium]
MLTDVEKLPRGTVTFLFTDIEGSTDLVRRLGDRFGDVRVEHRQLIGEACSTYAGFVIDTQGDAVFAVFDRAVDAVAAAIAAQRSLAALEWPEGAQLRVRMGLHTAEPYLHSSGYVGIGVHRAARICAAAHGGQILVSNATAGIVEDQELPDLDLRDLGEYRLKDLSRPQRLFEVVAEGLEGEFAPPKALDDRGGVPYGQVGTVVATDIVGWGRIIRAMGDDAAAEIAADYQRIVIGSVGAHNGHVLEAVADMAIAVFPSARDAVSCAVALRHELRRNQWPADVQLAVCFALHTGRLVAQHHSGLSVWHCVTLCDAAEPWQILVSHSTEALLEGERLEPSELRDLGERVLPNFESAHHVFELVG